MQEIYRKYIGNIYEIWEIFRNILNKMDQKHKLLNRDLSPEDLKGLQDFNNSLYDDNRQTNQYMDANYSYMGKGLQQMVKNIHKNKDCDMMNYMSHGSAGSNPMDHEVELTVVPGKE